MAQPLFGPKKIPMVQMSGRSREGPRAAFPLFLDKKGNYRRKKS